MLRNVFMFAIVFAFCGVTNANPPSENDWWEALDRYCGEWLIVDEKTKEPSGYFEKHWFEWEPKKITRYGYESIGDETPWSRSAGFAFWNDKTNRIEFNEIDFGTDGRMAIDGYCENVTEDTMTWVVTFWTHEGIIRRTRMTDTWTEEGIERVVVNLMGDDMDTDTIAWVKVDDHHNDWRMDIDRDEYRMDTGQ